MRAWHRFCCIGLASIFIFSPESAQAEYTVDINAPRKLKALLKAHLDLARFAKRTDISEEQFEFLVAAAPQQARELAETEGYFSAAVITDVSEFADKHVVTINIDPGPHTTVSSVALNFTGPMQTEDPGRGKAARRGWTLRRGELFSQAAWENSKAASLKALQAERYAAAQITHSQARIDPRTQHAQLEATFESGQTFTIGPIEISGLKRYPEKIIHHVNPLRPGERYSVERLLELQRQVQNTTYFASVTVDVANDAKQPNQVPVKVKVSEYPFHAIRSGIGYSSDTGARVQGHYVYNNMFGRSWILSAQGQFEQRQQNTALRLSMPPDRKAYINSILGSHTRTYIEDTDIRSLRLGAQRARSLQDYDYAWSLLYYEDQLLQNAQAPEVSRALVPGWSWTRRNVDDSMFARQGNIISLATGFAVKGILTEQSFGRFYMHGRQYFPLGKNDVILLRAELGSVLTGGGSDGIPASLLFRAGGANSVRGYSYQSIGHEVDGSVLPAKYLATGSGEYQHWFNRDWGAALFYDVGTATDRWQEKILYQGVGIGVRWRSLVGPINLDLGYGLRERRIRPYLTLGIAF
ncbi:autotransporter assembly complex family protein [Mycoavidus sp. B2-EB]|uniref:autotransporter assembly complex protein TamA n=1 Tax=Mycoavidus sp. B2-EB TaxID=2651972 RepID=UPI0016253C9F